MAGIVRNVRATFTRKLSGQKAHPQENRQPNPGISPNIDNFFKYFLSAKPVEKNQFYICKDVLKLNLVKRSPFFFTFPTLPYIFPPLLPFLSLLPTSIRPFSLPLKRGVGDATSGENVEILQQRIISKIFTEVTSPDTPPASQRSPRSRANICSDDVNEYKSTFYCSYIYV